MVSVSRNFLAGPETSKLSKLMRRRRHSIFSLIPPLAQALISFETASDLGRRAGSLSSPTAQDRPLEYQSTSGMAMTTTRSGCHNKLRAVALDTSMPMLGLHPDI